jgi:PucR family transcriptional regulator, purine catabolism regulatory protein
MASDPAAVSGPSSPDPTGPNPTSADPTSADPTSQENAALRGLVAVYRHLSTLAAQDSSIEAVTEVIAERMQVTVAVVDERMTVLAASSATRSTGEVVGYVRDHVVHPKLAEVLSITGRTRRAVRIPDVRPVSEASPVIVAPIPVGDDVPAYLLTVDDGGSGTGEDVRVLVTEHAATICGVILGRERVVAAAAARAREDLMEALLSGKGNDPEEMLRWARHLGYDETCEHRVLTLVVESGAGDGAAGGGPGDRRGRGDRSDRSDRSDRDESSARVPVAIERFFNIQATDAITAVRGGEVVVVLPEPERRLERGEQLVAACLARMRQLFSRTRVTAGIGGRCRAPEEIAGAYEDARRTVEVARRMGRAGTAVSYAELGIHRLLLQVADLTQLREFVREVFGELYHHPRAMTEYLPTLKCYLRTNLSPQRASKELNVHPNTVSYRIQRIAEITSLDFGDYRDRLVAQVALEILDAVGEES